MDEYPLQVEEISLWLRSKEPALVEMGIVLAEVRENHKTCKPSVGADFDSEYAMGRIACWVSGEFDFEILRVVDGQYILLRHLSVADLRSKSLDDAYEEFLQSMLRPKSR